MGVDLPGPLDDNAVDLANDGLSKAGDALDKGKEVVGREVSRAGHVIGYGLESLGADGAADAVADAGDSLGSTLGADIAEQQLDHTDQPEELIHGNPAELRESAGHLRDFARAFGAVGQGMKAVDSSPWQGEAAHSFRKKFGLHPVKWLQAADACEEAMRALETYAEVVEWARGRAREAVELYRQGKRASDEHTRQKLTYMASGQFEGAPRPPESDPGEGAKQAARELLDEALRQRDAAGASAASLVRSALRHAPNSPSPLGQLKADASDAWDAHALELAHAGSGAVKAGAGALNMARGLNPLDPYNLTHPAAYHENLSLTLAGLTSSVTHPERAVTGAYAAFKNDPSEFVGRLLPEMFAGRGAGFSRNAMDLAGEQGVRRGLPDSGGLNLDDALKRQLPDQATGLGDLPRGQRTPGEDVSASPIDSAARKEADANPDSTAQQRDQRTCEGDPVDVATGYMVMWQTDVSLPGILPLEFKRSFKSASRSGRWFGPTWTSTVDQRLEIDSQGVVLVTDDGMLLTYPHPAPGLPVLPTHGPRWPLDREEAGYTVTDPKTGRVWHFTDHSPTLALLEQYDDRNGNWITFGYDSEGAPATLTHSDGRQLVLSTQAGRVTSLTLRTAVGALTELRRFGYTDGHLTHITNADGHLLRLDCDELGRITAWTDCNNSRFTYTYDDQDRCTFQEGEAGHLRSRFTYTTPDPATGQHTTTVTDALGHCTRYTINHARQVIAETGAHGHTTRFERDGYNRLLSRTDPLGHITTFTYDQAGNLVEVTRPDGRHSTAEYNQLGLPVRVLGFDGTVQRYEYDARGNRVAATDAAGHTTRFGYDEAGRVVSVTDPAGAVTYVWCDGAGLPVAVTDPLGVTTRCVRDELGRVVSVTDPGGSTTHLTWTVEGKLARRTAPDGTTETWTYDGEGNCLTHTNPLGGTSHFEYTHFDLLTARTGPDGVRHEFSHDPELRLTQVTNPQGLTWTYEYDGAGNLVRETDFDDRVQRYEHDEAGRLTARVTPLGDRITFDRNSLGQITRKHTGHGQVTTYAYDFTDQLAQATNPDTTLTILRDRYGRVRSETVAGRELTYTYDEFGRRNGRVTPSGAVSSWTYDASGHRKELVTSGHRIAYTRDAAGRELSRSVGDLLTIDHSYDAMGRRTGQSVVSGDDRRIQHRAYHYRADGNLTAIEDLLGGTRTFDLDPNGRVTAVHAHNWSETYAYDAAGNQTHASWPDTHPGAEARGERAYTGTRITRAGNMRYEHDAAGRVVLRQKTRLSRKPDTWRYQWDAEDRLREVTTPDGTVWRYAYDALGRRISKSRIADDGQTVTERVDFTWDGTTLCEQVSRATSTPNPVTLTWDHDGLHPLAQTERITAAEAPQQEIDARFFAIVTDLVGTPTELVTESGEVAWRTRATLWGSTAWTRDSTAYTPLRFPGQYFDPETGLHYNHFRHYAPEVGRYSSADPLGLVPDPNPITYVGNPTVWADPLGLASCTPERISGGGWRIGDGNPLDIVPSDAQVRNLTPDPNGGAQKGVEYKWTDPETGNVVRMRVHDADGNAPEGSNARNGDIYRLSIGGKYQDAEGVLYHRQVHNPNSPHYNPEAANATHIPWPQHHPLPY